MPRPRLPAERYGERRHLDGGLEAFGVHRARTRGEDHVHPRRRAARRIVLERLRITLEVAAAVELDRVHEDRDDDAPRPPPRLGDQGNVPLVERAHGGHERDTLTPRARRVRPCLHGARLEDGLHQPALAARGAKACASVGKRPPFTSATYSPAARTTSRPSSAYRLAKRGVQSV